MILVTGGSASGKSEYAEELVLRQDRSRRIYIATMHAWDEESKQRIRTHRQMRSRKQFTTVERYTELKTLNLKKELRHSLPLCGEEQSFVVLLECMSNLVANEVYELGGSAAEVAGRVLAGVLHLREQAEGLIIVTNEVFSDEGNYDEETKRYLSILGEINRRLAELAEEVYEVVYGIPVVIKK